MLSKRSTHLESFTKCTMISKVAILVFAAVLAVSLAMPQFGYYRPGQASAGGFSGTSSGLFGSQGVGAGYGSASGPHAAFASGYGSSSSGFGGSSASGGGTGFGF